jgi:hypothetical protein
MLIAPASVKPIRRVLCRVVLCCSVGEEDFADVLQEIAPAWLKASLLAKQEGLSPAAARLSLDDSDLATAT